MTDSASGLGSGAAVSSVRGPRDLAALKIQSDEVAVIRDLLAIDDSSTYGDFLL